MQVKSYTEISRLWKGRLWKSMILFYKKHKKCQLGIVDGYSADTKKTWFHSSLPKGVVLFHFNSRLTAAYNLKPETIVWSLFKPTERSVEIPVMLPLKLVIRLLSDADLSKNLATKWMWCKKKKIKKWQVL